MSFTFNAKNEKEQRLQHCPFKNWHFIVPELPIEW